MRFSEVVYILNVVVDVGELFLESFISKPLVDCLVDIVLTKRERVLSVATTGLLKTPGGITVEV